MIIDELFEAPQQCPECGGISFSDLILAEKKDACYHKVKASAKVWPSAYASGRLVQCRKKGAANYGNKSEGVAEGTRAPNEIGGADSMRQKLGDIIKQAAQDDEVAYNKPRLYRKLWITYGGDIDAIIAERSIFELQQLARELVTANKQGMAEGVMYGAENLNVGDDVIISGDVELNGATGVIDSFGKDKRFVVVDLYNHGRHSFHSSDVSANDYDRDEKENDDDLYGRRDDLDEGGNVFMPNIQNTPEYKAGFATGKLPVPHPEGTQQYANYYKGVIDKASPTLSKVGEGEQQKGADYRDPKEVDYDDEYDAMVARVKKLAGLGPLKTVYDPNRRVYRNMPTAQQPKK